MAGNELSLNNVINISVSQAQAGVGEYNTSNLALFSHEAYDSGSFGSAGYKIYLGSTEVAEDFGTESETYAMAQKIFAQKPNILAGNGYLVIIPFVVEQQTLGLSGVPASGSFTLTYDGNTTAAIDWDDTASEIQTKLRALPGLEMVVVTGSLSSQSVLIKFAGVYGNIPLVTVGGSGLQTSAPAAITITPTQTVAGETYDQAIVRTASLVQYFGLMATLIFAESEMLAAAATIQTLNKIGFFASSDSADIEPDGMIDLLAQGGFTQSRGLYYGGTDSQALGFMAAYGSRGLSVNFAGSNTTMTMHLKDLSTVLPDPTMTQTLLNKAQAAGADCYVSLQGVAKTFCSNANMFFDQVYNLQWFAGALQVAGFNFLAQSATKVPQTEAGMDGLKGAYRNVCQQAVANQYCAPGEWNSSTTFGNQADFLANIQQAGYYIYSQPISQQSQADREDRKAPIIQIALKEAGAIHSSTVLVYINA